jgi:hypothetical protein
MERIIATGDVRGGRDTKLVMARNRWFESISLQRRVAQTSFRLTGCAVKAGWHRIGAVCQGRDTGVALVMTQFTPLR